MMISKILLAVEDIGGLIAMEEFIAQLRWRESIRVKILHVIEPKTPIPAWLDSRIRAEAFMEEALDHLSERFPELDIESSLLEGSARDVIVAKAEDWGADAILVGTEGRHGLDKFFLGSVSKDVMINANCSVIVLRKVKSSANSTGDQKKLQQA